MRKLILSLVLLAGCAESGTEPVDFATGNYRYDLQVSCFCPQEYVQPVTIEVRDDKVVRVTSQATGKEVAFVPAGGGWPTVDRLFEVIRQAKETNQPLEVRYDRELRYPTYIKVGTPENDAGAIYTAANLKPL